MVSKVIRDIRLLGFIVPERNCEGDYYTVIAWCFECKGWHSHSGFRREPEQGLQLHRYPHCWSESYRQNEYDGYIVEISGKATPEILRDYQRKRPRGLKATGWKQGESPIADKPPTPRETKPSLLNRLPEFTLPPSLRSV